MLVEVAWEGGRGLGSISSEDLKFIQSHKGQIVLTEMKRVEGLAEG